MNSKKHNCKDFRSYLKYIKPYWYILALVLLLSIIGTLLTIVSPYILKMIVDKGIMNNNISLMVRMVTILTVVGLVGTIVAYFSSYYNGWVTGKIMMDLRKDIFSYIILLPQSFFKTQKIGDLIQRINNEVDIIKDFLSNSFIRAFKAFLMITGCIIGLFILSYKLFLLISLTFPISWFMLHYFRPKVKKVLEKVRTKDSEIISFFIEIFTNIKIIQAYNTYSYENQILDEKLKNRFNLGLKRIKLSALNNHLQGLIMSLSLVLLFSYGGYLIISNQLTVGALLAFINYLMFLMNPVRDIQNLYMEYIRVVVSIDRINEIMATDTILQKNSLRKEKFIFKDKITITNVSFKYDNKFVLNNLNLELKKGKVYGLIGSSGCGKTTLMNLLMQFQEFTTGQITIDGTSIQNIDIFGLRDKIGYVSQDNLLFNDSIMENLKRGNINSTKTDVIKACKNVRLYNYIQTLRDKFESKVGEQGAKISGGEKQRIALARIFLRKNDIIILDEAFASLDEESENSILSIIRERFSKSLIIVISHRLSTMKYMDEIIILKNGKVKCIKVTDNLIQDKKYQKLIFEQIINEN